LQQVATLIVAWLHGCMGLHFWLRTKPWYPRLVPALYSAALLLPTLALLGFANAGQEVAQLAQQPGWVAAVIRDLPFPTQSQIDMANAFLDMAYSIFIGLMVVVVVARLARAALESSRGVFHLSYPGGKRVRVSSGSTILEASRAAAIPHAQVCGGRGRCSTCRVRCGEGFDLLDPPSADEQLVLDRVAAPPRVRLACQTRPLGDLEVTPLLPPTATPRDGRAQAAHMQGSEQEIAILFADLRGFTKMSEKKLPYDVVFLLNRYFRAMGEAIESTGGQVDKFIGDGVMALFGINVGPERGCREALAGARAMGEALEELNKSLKSDLTEPLRIGIGIHTGPVIVGEMGYGDAISITAIGDAVNTASRLEAMTKEMQCQLIVSADVEARSKVDLAAYPNHRVEVRGREEPLTIRTIDQSSSLPPTVGS
jgi:adenylate cyclase